MIELDDRIVSRVFHFLFWAALLFTFACAIAPAEVVPKLSESDKVAHIVAFSVLTAFAVFSFRQTHLLIIGIWLVVFGALIEAVQMIPSLNRQGDAMDWAADTVAIIAVLLLIGLARRLTG